VLELKSVISTEVEKSKILSTIFTQKASVLQKNAVRRFLFFDERKTTCFSIVFAHNCDAVCDTGVVTVKQTLCATRDFRIYGVVGRNKVSSGFEHTLAFRTVDFIRNAFGVVVNRNFFGATAIAFVVLTVFKSAFEVFHKSFSLLV
jgi:hypothetical protein